MKIDPRRCNIHSAASALQSRGIREPGSLTAKLPAGRLLPDEIDPASRLQQHVKTSLPFQVKNLRLTKARISKLQKAAIKVSGLIDTLKLTSDERTDLYATLLYAHVKNAQHDIGELPGLECVLERFSLMVGKLLANRKIIFK